MIDQSNMGITYLSIGIVFSAIGGILLRYNNGMHFDLLSLIAVLSMNFAMVRTLLVKLLQMRCVVSFGKKPEKF